jgi:hypothetical protein
MTAPSPALRVKIASEPFEFEQIYALNHRTFAEEIPRYAPTPERRLIDRFHDENTYVIALRGDQVAGMVAVRDRRPFSIDQQLPDVDAYLPPGRLPCELRLLAVNPNDRRGRLLPLLLAGVWQHCQARGFTLAIISGITTQQKLYEHLGFEAFGPLIGPPEVKFQPMMLTLERFAARAGDLFARVRM